MYKNTGTVNGFVCSLKDGKDLLKTALEGNNSKLTVSSMLRANEDWLNVFQSKHHPVGTFFDFRCSQHKKIFLEISQGLMLNASNIILIYEPTVEIAFSYLEHVDIPFDSEVAVLGKGKIYDLYKIHVLSPLIMNSIGFWDEYKLTMKEKLPRNDLKGHRIKGSIVLTNLQLKKEIDAEKQILNFTLDPQLDVLSRFGFTVHKQLEKLYNFRIIFNTTHDWGYYRKTLGHFDPGTMFRAIELGEADLGLSCSRIFSERLSISFFIPPLKKFRTCFVFKHPSTLAAYSAFAMPFTMGSWACTFCMILLAGLILRLIRNFKIKDNPPNDASFSASILLIIGTMCQQGLYVDSLRLSTRVLSIFLELMSLLIYSFYGAELVGFLLTPLPKNINSIDKLIDSPIKLYAENLSYHRTHFTGNISEKVTKAYEKALKGPTPDKDNFINLTTGIEMVQKGGTALYGQESNLYTVIEKSFSTSEKCALSEIEMLLLWTTTVIRKKSPFRELTYKGIMIVRESGILLREDLKWHHQRPHCLGKEGSDAVTYEATLVAQILFVIGVMLAIIFYLFEKQIEKRKNKNRALEILEFQCMYI
ncbi:uncharacterized protein LOC106661288 [Cimex lectularius]|uniref:Ionotropic glutamate receptor C-terminal domain-containing protein n=1 Tax=Cimex lectularius TaxID=79782 RepID=A0A8I6SFZ2_CIMLE|nr:uncharacterized protein LOC106661288 [Cimex lectularius]